MKFEDMMPELRSGKKATRLGWNGRGMFIFLVNGSSFQVNRPPLLGMYPEGTVINYHPHIDIKMVDGSIMTWTPAQIDLMADDWAVVPVTT